MRKTRKSSMGEFVRTGGGRFDPHEHPIYFTASGPSRLAMVQEVHDHLLLAVNEIDDGEDRVLLGQWTRDPRKRIFLDSGVFHLAMAYARTHHVSHDIGLSMAPDDMDGFSELFDRYVDMVRTYGDGLWGYIEIDQGGRENKIKTRARLEALGLRPIPVYHPLHDGWDYFDYLAERYDRICFGNIVKANRKTRIRLVATAWDRHRKYPHVWIHMLGLTPNEWVHAFPVNSADSSSWLHPVRWSQFPVHCDGVCVGDMGRGYRYRRIEDGGRTDAEDGANKAVRFCGYTSHMEMLAWRTHLKSLTQLGFEVYPKPDREVRRACDA